MSTCPAILRDHLKRKVRRIAAEAGPHTNALWHLAAAGRREWTPEAWKELVSQIDNCELSLEDWLLLQ